MIYCELNQLPETCVIVDPLDFSRRRQHGPELGYEDMLVPVARQGEVVYELPPLPEIQKRTHEQLQLFHNTIVRLDNPHSYPVGLEEQLHEQKTRLVEKLRGNPG